MAMAGAWGGDVGWARQAPRPQEATVIVAPLAAAVRALAAFVEAAVAGRAEYRPEEAAA